MRPRDQKNRSNTALEQAGTSPYGGTHSGSHCVPPDIAVGLAVVVVVAADQQGSVIDLEACGAYYGCYPPNCSVPNAPKSAEKVVAKGVAVGCATPVRSGTAAYEDLVGHYLYSDAWIQGTREVTPVMESGVGRRENPLDGA